MSFKETPAYFKQLVAQEAGKTRIHPAIEEKKWVTERANGRSVTLKMVYVILYKSNDATVRVEYEDGEVAVNILERSDHYYRIDWSPFDLRNLAKALELAAKISEEWYVQKYAAEHKEEYEKELANAA